MGKGLDFSPNQKSLDEPKVRKKFEDFCRRMYIKWNYRDEPFDNFSDKPVFHPKSDEKSPPGHTGLELFFKATWKINL